MVLLLLGCFALPVGAAGEEELVPGVDELYEQAQDYGINTQGGLDGGINALREQGGEAVVGLLTGAVRTGVRLLVVVVLCGLAESAGMGKSGGVQIATVAGALAVTALSVGEMGTMIGLGRQTIDQIGAFSQGLLPVMATLTAATGTVTAAAVKQGATVLFSGLLIALIDRLLLPLVYAYVAACCAHAAMDNVGLKKIADLIKRVVQGVLTTFLLAFVAYLTISGAIAGTADAAVVKATRMAMSRAIPVVGGILSDAAETMLVGAGVLRGTVGVVGMVTVLAICLVPFLQLGVHYLTYKLTAALSATVAQPKISGLIDAISAAFGLVLGMTGACALLLMISLVSAVTAVVT